MTEISTTAQAEPEITQNERLLLSILRNHARKCDMELTDIHDVVYKAGYPRFKIKNRVYEVVFVDLGEH